MLTNPGYFQIRLISAKDNGMEPVSYTHLDVYKRQRQWRLPQSPVNRTPESGRSKVFGRQAPHRPVFQAAS